MTTTTTLITRRELLQAAENGAISNPTVKAINGQFTVEFELSGDVIGIKNVRNERTLFKTITPANKLATLVRETAQNAHSNDYVLNKIRYHTDKINYWKSVMLKQPERSKYAKQKISYSEKKIAYFKQKQ